jgi:hypothetical protein
VRSAVVEKVCRVPDLLKVERNKSVLDLVADSGYFEQPDALTVEGVSAYLRDHSELIHSWLLYSSDKRTGSGWYFDEPRPGEYVVGYYPGGPRGEFHDATSACAEFIWRELSEFATRHRRER